MIKKTYYSPRSEDFSLEDAICQASMGTEDIAASDPVDFTWDNI